MYKNVANATQQVLFCSIPLRLDTYQGCEFGCKYCFANQKNTNGLVQSNMEYVAKKVCDAIKNKNNENIKSSYGAFSQFVKSKIPIHFGGLSDPFTYKEKELGITYRVLFEFTETEYPLVISTKSIIAGDSEYLAMLKKIKNNLIFQMSIPTVKYWKQFEGNSPNPELRIKTLEKLTNAGIKCFVRVQPFILETLEEQVELFRIYKECGVVGVIVEGLRIKNKTKYTQFANVFKSEFGYDIKKYFLSSCRQSIMGNKYYPENVKQKYHETLKDAAHKNGLIYLAADNDFRYIGDNPNCCGSYLISNTSNDCNITHLAYYNHNDFGFHLIRDRDDVYLQTSVAGYSSVYQIAGTVTTKDHMRAYYNNPTFVTELMPNSEILFTDTDGNVHYKLNI